MSREKPIQDLMTILEAAALWSDPQREHLEKWGERFAVRLKDFHIGHIRTYQEERVREVTAFVVNLEVAALLALLREVNAGADIAGCYRPLKDSDLTPDEMNCLPPRVQAYIHSLKRDISGLQMENDHLARQFKRTTWGRKR